MKSHFAIALIAAALAAMAVPAGAQDQKAPAAKFDVSVQGQVIKPGRYSISPEYTVIDAVELAGGFTERALRSSVKITHAAKDEGGAQTTTLDYSDIALNKANADFKLQPGDVIFIPADPAYGK